MAYLLDTNLLFRRFVTEDSLHGDVTSELDHLMRAGESFCSTAQNPIEYRALATRSIQANRPGLTPIKASADARRMEDLFVLVADSPEVYPIWRDLVDAHGVAGRQFYDARLVAVMLARGISHIRTLNARHFRRFAEIVVVEPADLLP